MKVKAKKILAISLPITFGLVTLTTSSAAIVSCSSNDIDANQQNKPDISTPSNEILVSNEGINSLSSAISNSSLKQYTINQFNDFFTNSYKETSINKVAEKLGIDSIDIASVIASGPYYNGTITINAKDGYTFNLKTTFKTIEGSISSNKQSIVFNNIKFAPEKINVENFASSINLTNTFITTTNTSEITSSSSTTNGVQISNNGLTVNIVSNNTNSYFNVALPSNVNNVFDVPNGNTIEWSLQENTNNDFKLGGSNNNQCLYNSSVPSNSNKNSITLIAKVKDVNGNVITNDINVTFNFEWKLTIMLNSDDLSGSFIFDWNNPGDGQYEPNNTSPTITTSANQINVNLNWLANLIKRSSAMSFNVYVNLSVLNYALTTWLSTYINTNEITGINWNSPTVKSYESLTGGNSVPIPYFSDWNGTNSETNSIVIYAKTKSSLSWTVDITTNNNNYKNFSITFGVNIDID